eukprot:TRINITY_DN544_c0_g1_i1.p1 TRINITY_DN544_c0_g1~~TRINITY_DN544_c0_g1_i1.p1  ORF type:complete len:215 (+),score=-4.74 TRINITY_DN544_c0_g1_i1:285-929(+)
MSSQNEMIQKLFLQKQYYYYYFAKSLKIQFYIYNDALIRLFQLFYDDTPFEMRCFFFNYFFNKIIINGMQLFFFSRSGSLKRALWYFLSDFSTKLNYMLLIYLFITMLDSFVKVLQPQQQVQQGQGIHFRQVCIFFAFRSVVCGYRFLVCLCWFFCSKGVKQEKFSLLVADLENLKTFCGSLRVCFGGNCNRLQLFFRYFFSQKKKKQKKIKKK